jgi:signal transduction histidine kinase
MRDSIALRVTLAVFGALVLTQVVGYLLFTGERLHLLPLMKTGRVEAIVRQAVDSVLAADPERRAAEAAALDIPQVQAMLSPVFAPTGEIVDPPPLHSFRRKMLAESGGRFDMLLVEIPSPPSGLGPPELAKLWLRMPDRTWLVLTVPGAMLRQPDLLRMALWWGLSLLGAIPLSLFVARRLTAPIRRFSKAAEQLGLDISASPLPETGPAELRAAAAAINGMQDRIKRFVDDRTLMLAAISHDLRTPISRLRLRAENLGASGRQPMIDDLQHMDRMIAATLDFARDANSGEAPCRIDLVSLVETECETLADLGRDIAYRGPSHLAFTCRPLALGRAVRNVFENAVAYGGRTIVTVIDRTDRTEIEVADSGPGIPEAEQSRVFEPFYRLDRARSAEQPGTGLGLSIARNILRAHGGDITLKNRESGGLLVVLRLPRASA